MDHDLVLLMATFDLFTKIKNIRTAMIAHITSEIAGVGTTEDIIRMKYDQMIYDKIVPYLKSIRSSFDASTQTDIDTLVSDFTTHVSSEYSMSMQEFTESTVILDSFLQTFTVYKELLP